MIDPKTITKEQLADDAFVYDVRNSIDDALQAHDPKRALQFAAALNSVGGNVPKTLTGPWLKATVLALPLMDDQSVESALSGSVRPLLGAGLRQRIRDRLVALPPSTRDKVKNAILMTLEKNATHMTDGGFGTVKGWVKNFQDAHRSPEDYASSTGSVQTLTPEDRDALLELFRLVRDLESSSLTHEGLEDEILVRDTSGAYKVWTKGVLAPVGPDTLESPAPAPKRVNDIQRAPAAPAPKAPPAPKKAEPSPYTTKASFFFHTEDDDEIRAHARRLAGEQNGQSSEAYERFARAVADAVGITLADAAIVRRFQSIVTSRVQEVRDVLQTKEMLIASTKDGGVGLTPSQADAVLTQIEKQKTDPVASPVVPPVSPPKQPTPDTGRPQSHGIAPPSIPKRGQPVEAAPLPVTPVLPVKSAPAATKIRVEGANRPPDGQRQRPIPPSIVRPVAPRSSSKPQVEDIRSVKRTTGPLDELATMTLKDFQRLGHSTDESVEKILEKLDILEEEGFTQRMEGIKSWRKSPLFRLYLDIGRESMVSETPVADVLTKRASGPEPSLTEEEFRTIADLNKSLAF